MSEAAPWLDGPVAPNDAAEAAPWLSGPVDPAWQRETLGQPTPSHPGGILNAIQAGLQASSAGLALRGKKPDTTLSPDAAWYERAAAGVGGLIGDAPAMIAGGALGSPIPVVGTAAGAFAVPQAIREALMQAYDQGGANSWEDVWGIIKAGGAGAAKGAVIGAATGGAGKVAGAFAAGAAPLVRGAAVVGSEVTAMTTAGAALEGRMPTSQDFLDAAILVGGLHAITPIAARLRNIYAKTGVLPSDVALAAQKDAGLKTELTTSEDIPAALKPLAAEENARAAVPDPKELSPEAQAFKDSPFAIPVQEPGAQAVRGHINIDYINDPADFAPVVARIEELYGDKIQAAIGGTKSQAGTIQTVKQRIADGLGVKGADIPFDEHLTALDMIYTNIAELAKKQATELTALGDRATTEQKFQYQLTMNRLEMAAVQFLPERAAAARAMGMMKTAGKARIDPQTMLDFIAKGGGEKNIMDLAKVVAEADNPASIRRAGQEAFKPTTLQKAIEIWKASILTGPTTLQANFYGDIVGTAFSLVDQTVAAAVNVVRGGGGVTLRDVAMRADGMQAGVMDGLKAAGAMVTGKTIPTNAKGEPYLQAVGGKFGEVVQVPYRALTATDLAFRIPNERGEGYVLGARDADAKGLVRGTREYAEHVVDFVQNPSEETAAAMKAAGDRALYTTPLGPRMKAFQNKVVRGSWMEFVMPFITTPANLLKWGADYIPGVNFMMKSVREDLSGRNGRAQQDLAYGRMVTGSVILGVITTATIGGIVTGGGLATPEQTRTKHAAGWQPYSIKIGDKYHSYMRIDPLARVLATAADWTEIYNASEHDDKINMLGVLAGAVGNATVSQSYLSGLSHAINAITDPNRYAGRFLDQYAASAIPASGLLGQIATSIDPQMREINSVFDAMQARIPFLRERLLPQINPLTGEQVAAPGAGYQMSPVKSTIASDDPVLTEAMRLGVNISAAPKKVHVGRNTGKIGDVEISPEARNAFTQKQGEFTHQIMSPIVNGPGWGSIPDIAKAQIYKKVLASARQQAALVALPPEARIAEASRIAQEMAAQFTP